MDEDDDYQGGIGDIHGIGTGADHFMNQDYIRAAHSILTGTYDQATAAANYVMGGGPSTAWATENGGSIPCPPTTCEGSVTAAYAEKTYSAGGILQFLFKYSGVRAGCTQEI
ncbi:hypothetical protein LSUE1_G009228 [Lachnellula suecica]|uniref:Uncharacterized protein n=1 Tax=Lachnellula suecica TaxID=602035 RepID=A0A8T9C3A7_9HELO|nr:hypothetical protein LSUE1_G009228 [Lachnellula suecica]